MITAIITLVVLLIIGAIGGALVVDRSAKDLVLATEDADEMRHIAKGTLDREVALKIQVSKLEGRLQVEKNVHQVTSSHLSALRKDYDRQIVEVAQLKRDIETMAERFDAATEAHQAQAEAYDIDIRQMADQRDEALASAARNNKGQEEQHILAEKSEKMAEVLRSKLFAIQQVLTAPRLKKSTQPSSREYPDGF